MFALKRLSPEAVPAALERAERYRLLNEPLDAESICEDVLAVSPGHQGALVMLLLSLTDQFGERLGPALARARGILSELQDPYTPVVLHGAGRGARGEGAPATRRVRLGPRGLRAHPRSDDRLRASRGDRASRQRRSDSEVEHLRAADRLEPAGGAGAARARRALARRAGRRLKLRATSTSYELRAVHDSRSSLVARRSL